MDILVILLEFLLYNEINKVKRKVLGVFGCRERGDFIERRIVGLMVERVLEVVRKGLYFVFFLCFR